MEADSVTVKMVVKVPIVEATNGGKVRATLFVDALTGYVDASALRETQNLIGFERAEDAQALVRNL